MRYGKRARYRPIHEFGQDRFATVYVVHTSCSVGFSVLFVTGIRRSSLRAIKLKTSGVATETHGQPPEVSFHPAFLETCCWNFTLEIPQ